MPRTATIITGNPEYIQGNPDADKFYGDIETTLKEQGLNVVRNPGLPKTMPRRSAVWLGHSRGVDRFRFAPQGQKTIPMGAPYEGAINHPKDNAMLPGQVPDKYHFMFTPQMRDTLVNRLSELGVIKHGHDLVDLANPLLQARTKLKSPMNNLGRLGQGTPTVNALSTGVQQPGYALNIPHQHIDETRWRLSNTTQPQPSTPDPVPVQAPTLAAPQSPPSLPVDPSQILAKSGAEKMINFLIAKKRK